jgi:sporulation protein YlmC with PRC-barrel domain
MATSSTGAAAIRAKQVLGTSVRDPSGQKIGEVEDLALDRLSPTILFAIVGFGGFLGMGEKYHAIPWMALDYDEEQRCYVVPFTKEQLRAAPADSMDALLQNGGVTYRDRAFDYYKVDRYW